MRRYHQVNLDPGSVSPDFNYSNCSDQTSANPLTYRNPTTGSDFTPEQIESIRNQITRLHPDTHRIAHTCDDDARDPNNEVYIDDSQRNRRHLTPGTTENEDGPWYIYHTTDGETTTHSANVGAQKLAADEILPTRLDDGSYSSSLCGGGLIRSYEKQHALVR